MDARQDQRTRTAAGALLIASVVLMLVGATLFSGRTFWGWPASAPSLVWERSVILTAVLVCLGGFALLELLLRAEGAVVTARLAFIGFLVGTVALVPAELQFMIASELQAPHVPLFVILAILSEIGFGVALVISRIVPAWIGWVMIAWNLSAALALLTLSPGDPYYPLLHFIAPLLVGIALLSRGRERERPSS